MLTPHIIATLENTLCRLVRMGKDVNGVRNELRQLIDQCRTLAPPMPTEEQERAEVRHRLDAFDGHLRELNKGMLRLRDAQREQVESEKKLPGNIMAGHGIDIKLAYVLAEDDPAFAEDADNILTERGGESNPSGGETIAEREFNIETENCPPASPVMSRQCWYVHNLTDHDMGPGQRRLGTMELLCIGHVWIDAVTTRQFCLNLRTGEYETALRISKGNNGMPMRCDETGGELYLHPFKTRYCYQFSHLEGSMLDPRDWQWFVLEQLFSDIDTTLGSDRRGFHWLQIEMKFNKTRLDARMDGQLLSRIFAEDIKDIQSRYRTTDQTLECVRQLIRIAEHQLADNEGPLRVFLDDERPTLDGWRRTYWFTDVIALLGTGKVHDVSLDYDLGIVNDVRGIGHYVLSWIEHAVATRGFLPPKIRVHTGNVLVREKMLASVQSIERSIEKNVTRSATQPLLACFRVASNSLGIEYGVMPLTKTVVMRLRQVAELCQQHQLVSAEISDIPVQWVRRGRRYVAYITGIQVFDSACCCFTAFFSVLPSGEIPDECECRSDDQLKPWFSPLPRWDGAPLFQHVNVDAFWLPAAKSMTMDDLRNVANATGEVWNAEDLD